MSCGGSTADVLAWWSGERSAVEDDAFEEHLFACARCAHDAEVIGKLATGTRALARAGRLHAPILPSLVDRLARDGLRVRTFPIREGEVVPCGVAPDDDLLVARLEVPLAGVSRIDCDAVSEATGEIARLEDVPFDPASDAVLFAERVAHARGLPAGPLRFTLYGTDAEGSRRLGTWTLVHDPAGPPAA